MKKTVPTREDRLYRLKTRLGWRPRKRTTRIKPGGWITLHPSFGVHAGDRWVFERMDETLILRRIDADAHQRFVPRIKRPGAPNARLQKLLRNPPL